MSTARDLGAELGLAAAGVAERFDRQPVGFRHNLATLPQFGADALAELAARFDAHPEDYFVAAGAPAPGAEFFSVPRRPEAPSSALAQLAHNRARILLKRPENHDPRFKQLMQDLYAQVEAIAPQLKRERIARMETAVFISSAQTTTPFHFDPEVGFFCQIEGEKHYHVYDPSVLDEPELERCYASGRVGIGQVDLAGRDPRREHVFHLGPGDGFHQTQDAPHWVETGSSRSVSYTLVFETESSRVRGRARGLNRYLRRLGAQPSPPDPARTADRLKSGTMSALLPVREGLKKLLRPARA